MTIDKQALREVAEKATKGPWTLFSDIDTKTFSIHTPRDKRCENVIKWGGFDCQPNAEANAEFIAAFNPKVALALLDELEHYKSREERVTKLVMDNSTSWDALYKKLEAAEKRIAEQQSAIIAPGIMRCAGCGFVLTKNNINMTAGTITAGDSKTEPCPNGCGPLWPVTWKEQTLQMRDDSEQWFLELQDAKNRIAELEAREIKPAKGEVLVVVSGFTGCGKSAIAGEIEIAMKAIGVPVKWTNGDAEKRMTGADWLTAIEMYKPTVRIVEVNVPRAAGIGIKGE
ncbi:ead/Ea22-like family protein [Salmonella enterica]|uniref:ead/Ea22-like family protein n=1 Tax=Salmonella enterica TaxID=28901 RepID=UPI0006D4AB88|nr:ead/Ea22-like family protein [Salmonella enterica]ECI4709979.1 ead/Ea22-like family protein [Salmonella enterica subsp. enterica]EBC6570637.1 ead/Ea22-like family protein [Salmonella enterica]EBV5464149.1 ead/Ea22-like family protein [Salmonella enterica subsp. enterica serovar Weltevreden]EBX9704147.1 ead/Ea22-like family protein [Salmonella enterica subsp. enterica serovar Weltevreden]EBY6764577.1 ead/Ea22-like family protein [Salmonella enterica subsp. enterica serovar Weltevreden]